MANCTSGQQILSRFVINDLGGKQGLESEALYLKFIRPLPAVFCKIVTLKVARKKVVAVLNNEAVKQQVLGRY